MSYSNRSVLNPPPGDAGDERYRDRDRLARYLGGRVLDTISGTGTREGDGKTLADLPSDVYFAGTLIPSRQAEISGLSEDLQSKLEPSAIQAEFLFDPREATELTVSVSGDVYYRSFPTYEEQFEESDVEVAEAGDTGDDTGSDDDTDQDEFAQVFRRVSFESEEIGVTVPSLDDGEDDVVTGRVEQSVIEALTDEIRQRVHQIDRSDEHPPVWRAATDVVPDGSLRLSEGSPISSDLPVGVDDYTGDYQFPADLFDDLDEGEKRTVFADLVDELSARGDPLVPPWGLDVQCEFTREEDLVRGTVTVENRSAPNPDTTGYDTEYGADVYDTTLFDLTATLSVHGGDFRNLTFERLDEDFRYDRSIPGHGTNCTVVRVDDSTLRTTYLPTHRQRRYVTRDPGDFEPPLDATFETLSDLRGGGLDALSNVAEQMRSYADETYEEHLKAYEADEEFRPSDREDFEADREVFRTEVARFERGIECLRWDVEQGDGHVARSFELMNETFASKVELDDGGVEFDSWRLFQLVFIVRVLPDIASREYDEWSEADWRDDGEDAQNYDESELEALDVVDILWFPTGGGKTEAYLGLAVFNAFFDRKRGKNYGVTAWTRFPLRLLSLQQTQRIGEILMYAELHRLEEPDIVGDGSFPFTLGYLVGSKNTPNKLSSYSNRRDATREDYLSEYLKFSPEKGGAEAREGVKIFPSCPVCGNDVEIRATDDLRLAHRCTADPEECAYQRRPRPAHDDYRIFADDELPIHIVDNELYRYAPTMIVGTIDKITAVGYERKSAHLYAGKMSHWCPDHGFASFGECTEKYGCHSRYGGDNSDDGSHLVRLEDTPIGDSYDIAPGLQIQDEMHLLEESLGTFDSHFETFVDAYQRYNGEQRTKIIGATATIEEYDDQARELYLRKAERFPVEGPKIGENFYATTRSATRRQFVGVMPHGKTHINAVIQLNYVYLREIESLREQANEASERLPLVDRLGFETVRTNDDLLDLLSLYETSLTYTISKRDKNRYTQSMQGQIAGYLRDDGLRQPNLAELTGETPFDEVEDILDNLEDPPETVTDRFNTIAATNMISHGVDVDRFNHMVFFGMPRQTAEYIQSSSRIGRSAPGVAFLCFNPARERDQSHYHLFEKYHEFLDRMVEPVPLNRWSHFSVRRTLPSMIFGWLLNQWLYETGERLYFSDQASDLIRALQSGRGRGKGVSIDDTGQFQDLLKRSYGRDLCGELPEAFREILDRERDRTFTNMENIQEDFASDGVNPGPMISLRDIDEQVPFVLADRDNQRLFDQLSGR